MALSETEQIFKAFKDANNILVATKPSPHADGVASALALGSVLKKLGKQVEIVSHDWREPGELQFLPTVDSIKPALTHLQKFFIELDVSTTPVKELSYDVKDNKLRIALVPKAGTWQPEQVTARSGGYRFDLICTIGVPDLASLGPLFDTHTDFFYHTPLVNIDHDPGNEHYGQINHVDINTTAICEVLYDLFEKTEKHLIDEEVATCLLAGMVSKTRSFKTPNVTPKTLRIASDLVTLGGKRDEIVHHLYRTRTVPVLRLWGRALARLKHDPATKFVWTMLSRQDFINAGADPDALRGVVDELIVNAPDARVALILYEAPEGTNGKGVVGILYAERPLSALELCRSFPVTGNRERAAFNLSNRSLIEAELLVTQIIRERLRFLTVS